MDMFLGFIIANYLNNIDVTLKKWIFRLIFLFFLIRYGDQKYIIMKQNFEANG